MLLFYSGTVWAQISPPKLRNNIDSLSYALGILFGYNIQSGGFESINTEVFARTVQSILQNEELQMSTEQANELVNHQYREILNRKFEKNLEDGRAFLKANKNAPGVVALPSGLQYKILRTGAGQKPALTDKVTVHYHGTLINGTVFDSTVERKQPIELTVNHVIPGWIEALQLMPAGSKWILYVPPELAYGENPRPGGPIEPNSTLIFEVEILSINN
jgi:FKBP-type peptidyl-prolyl cis-trans isomerase FklB